MNCHTPLENQQPTLIKDIPRDRVERAVQEERDDHEAEAAEDGGDGVATGGDAEGGGDVLAVAENGDFVEVDVGGDFDANEGVAAGDFIGARGEGEDLPCGGRGQGEAEEQGE